MVLYVVWCVPLFENDFLLVLLIDRNIHLTGKIGQDKRQKEKRWDQNKRNACIENDGDDSMQVQGRRKNASTSWNSGRRIEPKNTNRCMPSQESFSDLKYSPLPHISSFISFPLFPLLTSILSFEMTLCVTFLMTSMAAALSMENSAWHRLSRLTRNVLPRLSSSWECTCRKLEWEIRKEKV